MPAASEVNTTAEVEIVRGARVSSPAVELRARMDNGSRRREEADVFGFRGNPPPHVGDYFATGDL